MIALKDAGTGGCTPRRSEAGLDPAPVMQLSTAYWGSQALLTANRLGVFDALTAGPTPLEALSESLGTHPRATRLLLRACCALGLLEEDRDGFRNSALADAFLVRGAPAYLGDALRYTDDLYAVWGRLEQALREGRPALEAERYLGDDPERTRHFVHAMHNRALGIGRALVEMVDLAGRTRMLDIGGGPGTYSALFVRRHQGLRSQVLELPEVAALARGILEQMGVADRVTLLPGSYHETAFPAGNDVVLISGVFHRESAATCRALVARAADSLVAGGMLVVSDVFTDAGGTGPVFPALFGLNMMLTAPDGGVHADADVEAWMRVSGLVGTRVLPFPPPMPHRVVVGEKA